MEALVTKEDPAMVVPITKKEATNPGITEAMVENVEYEATQFAKKLP